MAVGASDPIRRGLPRTVEVVLSIFCLILTAPLIAIAGAAVAVTSGTPVFFRQTRVGRRGKLFKLVKLRTMRASRGGPQVTARDDVRVTPVGRFLRRTKLDELPELWNVLRGDMSLVGPRPEVPEYVDPTGPGWREVLLARPGLTDPVTLRLRDEEVLMAGMGGDRERFYREALQPLKLRGYAEYLRRRSWHSDLGVLFRTLLAILWPMRPISSRQPVDLSERPPDP